MTSSTPSSTSTSICSHFSSLRVPSSSIPIHKDECTQCFDTDEITYEKAVEIGAVVGGSVGSSTSETAATASTATSTWGNVSAGGNVNTENYGI